MLFMQNSPFLAHLNGSGLQVEGCSGSPSGVPTLSGIDASLRASISSTSASTGVSSDDISPDSPDWNGDSDQLPRADQDAQINGFAGSCAPDSGFMFDPRAQIADMSDAPPKVEELDDEDLQSIQQSEVGNETEQIDSPAGAPAAVPRKRGRPRKHPLLAPGNQAKVTKGRSKTGCITCRRRKKKCDETKPA